MYKQLSLIITKKHSSGFYKLIAKKNLTCNSSQNTILIIQPAHFPGTGGDSANYLEQIFAIKRKGLHPVLICLANREAKLFDNKMAKKDISVFRIPFNPPHLSDIIENGVGLSNILKLLVFYICELFVVLYALTMYPSKLCIIRHSIHTLPLNPILRILRIRSVADGEILSYYLQDAFNVRKLYFKILFPIEKKVLKGYSFFKVSTNRHMNMMFQVGFNKDKLIMSRAGVSLSEVPIYELKDIPSATFGFFGSLERWQGLHFLLRSFSKVLEEKKHAKLYIIGNGSLKEELRKFTEEIGILGNVIFLDAVPREVLFKRYFRMFRVAVIPRPPLRVPVFPIKLAESLASGKPVVATSIEGIREVVGGGILSVQPGDEDEMSEVMISLCEDDISLFKLSHQALESAKRFDVDDQVEKILLVLI